MISKPQGLNNSKKIIYDDFYRMITFILERDFQPNEHPSDTISKLGLAGFLGRHTYCDNAQMDDFYLDPKNKQTIVEAIFLLFTGAATYLLNGISSNSEENSLVDSAFLSSSQTGVCFKKSIFLMSILLVLKTKSIKDLMNNKEEVNLLHYFNGESLDSNNTQLFSCLFESARREELLKADESTNEVNINENQTQADQHAL
ncbi:MAG: hypothetical protein H8E74_00835 [Gammaproteobacteria bacterium]|nr:hypothetical protein [Gammaproteobacteria bacterium]